ncbi:hypothetical protein [Salinibacter phage 6_8]
MQDAARRQQQADEKVRELEKEIERLRAVLNKIAAPMAGSADRKTWQGLAEYRAQIAANALDGGGDTDA